MDKTDRILTQAFRICFLLIAAAILLFSGPLLAIAFFCAIFFLLRNRQIPKFTLLLFAGGLLLRLLIIFAIQPPPESDFVLLYDAAQKLLRGDLSYNSTTYFSLWAYSSAFVAWEAMWLSIWNNIIILKIVSAILSAGTVCLLYRIVRPNVRPASAQVMALLLTVFPFAATLPALLTNQTASAFFLVLAVWVLSCPDAKGLGFFRYPLCGIILQLGNFLRPEGIIVLTAIIVVGILCVVRKPRSFKRISLGLLAVIVMYTGCGMGANAFAKAVDLNPNGFENNLLGWKFVCGLNHETGGAYAQADWDAIQETLGSNHLPTPETENLVNDLIARRLSSPLKDQIKLVVSKVKLLWVDEALFWVFGYLRQTPSFLLDLLYPLLCSFDRTIFFIALALSALGLMKRKRFAPGLLLPHLVFAVSFCAFLLVESQPRYAYMPQLFLFAGAAYGIDALYDFVQRKS